MLINDTQKGFSLIEILISVLLSFLLLGSLIQHYLNSQRSAYLSSNFNNLQEDISVIKSLFNNALKSSGNQLCDTKVCSALENLFTTPSASFITGWEFKSSGYQEQISLSNLQAGQPAQVWFDGGSIPDNIRRKAVYGSDIIKTSSEFEQRDKYFYIALGGNNRASLFSTKINYSGITKTAELVENVETMQVYYGVDSDNDGVDNQYLSAQEISDWSKVHSLQIALILTSSLAITDFQQAANLIILGGLTVHYPKPDRFSRHVLNFNIQMRNS